MCGIVGFIGSLQAYPILVKGLKRLEYRGYDSAGVAMIENGNFNKYKCKGKVADQSALAIPDGLPTAFRTMSTHIHTCRVTRTLR